MSKPHTKPAEIEYSALHDAITRGETAGELDPDGRWAELGCGCRIHDNDARDWCRACAIHKLHGAGAKFRRYPVGGKTPIDTDLWSKTKVRDTKGCTLKQALKWNENLAILPSSLGCIVVDVDEGGEAAREYVELQLGQPMACYQTSKPGRSHSWYCGQVDSKKNWFHEGEKAGDILCASQYATVRDLSALANGLETLRGELTEAELAPLLGGDSASSRNRGDPGKCVDGNRHLWLNTECFNAGRYGDEARRDWAVGVAIAAGYPKSATETVSARAYQDGQKKGRPSISVTHAALHHRWYAEGVEEWRYATPNGGDTGKWVRWSGTHFRKVGKFQMYQHIRRFVRVEREGMTEKFRAATANLMESSAYAPGVESFNRGALECLLESFDADSECLNTPGGIVDLQTGEIRPHDKPRYYMKVTGVAPQEMDTPVWDKCLQDWFGHHDGLADFMTRLMGYSLRGDNRLHKFVFCFGPGGSGKGRFIKAWERILGNHTGDGYTRKAADSIFLQRKHAEHQTTLAGLVGARLVFVTEVNEGERWNESMLKTVSGGDTITARLMRQDQFDFEPQFLPVVTGNHQPSFTDVGEAMRRRLLLVPFDKTVPMNQRDETLDERLAVELPGILWQAIQGHRAYLEGPREDPLETPVIVREVTDEYFKDNDVLGQFIEEALILRVESMLPPVGKDSPGWTAARQVYYAYRAWCGNTGRNYPETESMFGKKLKERVRREKKGGMFYACTINKDVWPSPDEEAAREAIEAAARADIEAASRRKYLKTAL